MNWNVLREDMEMTVCKTALVKMADYVIGAQALVYAQRGGSENLVSQPVQQGGLVSSAWRNVNVDLVIPVTTLPVPVTAPQDGEENTAISLVSRAHMEIIARSFVIAPMDPHVITSPGSVAVHRDSQATDVTKLVFQEHMA